MKKIIEEKLNFLTEDFNFKFRFSFVSPNAIYTFETPYGQFIYHELPQFQEKYFYIIDPKGKREINLYQDYPSELKEWQKHHSGFKWIFKSKENDLWDFNAKIIKDTIEKTHALFGLQIE